MSASQPPALTLGLALKIVKSYDCAQVTNSELSIELEQLRNSLLLVTRLSSSQNLGICADNFQQGFAALTSYLGAFGYQNNLEQENVSISSKPVYLKFSTQKMS